MTTQRNTAEQDRELLAAFRADVERRLAAIKPPQSITELRSEYWKAGARAAIREVNEALRAAAALAQGEKE